MSEEGRRVRQRTDGAGASSQVTPSSTAGPEELLGLLAEVVPILVAGQNLLREIELMRLLSCCRLLTA